MCLVYLHILDTTYLISFERKKFFNILRVCHTCIGTLFYSKNSRFVIQILRNFQRIQSHKSAVPIVCAEVSLQGRHALVEFYMAKNKFENPMMVLIFRNIYFYDCTKIIIVLCYFVVRNVQTNQLPSKHRKNYHRSKSLLLMFIFQTSQYLQY